MIEFDISSVTFEKGNGLVTVVAQDSTTGVVLMVAHADREAVERTVETGEMHYRSRTRGLWHKGATSGNTQRVVSLSMDCDGDAILARVVPNGPACHTNSQSCFGELALDASALSATERVIAQRKAEGMSSSSYTQKLFADRNLRLKKLGEECAELIAACADGDANRASEELADFTYHALVALQGAGGSLDAVLKVLADRRKGD